jgi:hypothetical protein
LEKVHEKKGDPVMATMTAQILVGQPHIYHDGINPTHYLFLSENSRPAWILVQQNIFRDSQMIGPEKITWIPTRENMLEDAFLMIAIHVFRDPTIRAEARKCFSKHRPDFVELYNDISREDRERLYSVCRELDIDCTVVVTVLNESSIINKVSVANHYKWNIQICIPVRRE